MSDPWEDMRERMRIEDVAIPVGMLLDTRHLLTDADALLEVVRAADNVIADAFTDNTNASFEQTDVHIKALRKALAALPEHLRE